MSLLTLLLSLCLGPLATPSAAPPQASETPSRGLEAAAPTSDSGWRASEADNITGLTDLKKLSNPAVVDYTALLAATTEMKEVVRDRIDPDSAKGRSLRQQAADRVTKASEAVRKERRHCSIWKAIVRKDGRPVPDVTREVSEKLDRV